MKRICRALSKSGRKPGVGWRVRSSEAGRWHPGNFAALLGLLAAAAHGQVVFYRKHIGYAVGAQAGEILVALTVDHAFERDIPVFHDDVNRSHRGPRILAEARVP